VIELERHIEILLLSNDCVIVPNLGGFMAHHLEARYDEGDGMFLPPQRTLGFNPQLKLNDSLLAQLYVEAHDISYPEAVRRIEAEVAEMRQHLDNEGYYELNDIGCLTVNAEGKLEFEPCEAGILTPELYGLSSFEMLSLNVVKDAELVAMANLQSDVSRYDDNEDSGESHERSITIKMSWIRNTVAVAAAILAFFIINKPVSNSEMSQVSMSQINLPILTRDSNEKVEDVPQLDSHAVQQALNQETEIPMNQSVEAIPVESKASMVEVKVAAAPVKVEAVEAPAPEKAEIEETAPAAKPEPQPNFCIVVASQVSQRNAEAFAQQLQKEGFEHARVYINNYVRRVVCGFYQTEEEAYRQLQEVHKHEGLSEAWVYKIKH